MSIRLGNDIKLIVSTVTSSFTPSDTYRLNIISDSLSISTPLQTKSSDNSRLHKARTTSVSVEKIKVVTLRFSTYIKVDLAENSQDKFLWESVIGKPSSIGSQPYNTDLSTISHINPIPLNIYLEGNYVTYQIIGSVVKSVKIVYDIENYIVAEWVIQATSAQEINAAPVVYTDFTASKVFEYGKLTTVSILFNNTTYPIKLIDTYIKFSNKLDDESRTTLGSIAILNEIFYKELSIEVEISSYLSTVSQSLVEDLLNNPKLKGQISIASGNFNIILPNCTILSDSYELGFIWKTTFSAKVNTVVPATTLNQSTRLPNYEFKTIVNPNKYFKPKAWDVSMDWYTKIPAVIEEQPEPPPDWYLTSRLYNLEVADNLAHNFSDLTVIGIYDKPYLIDDDILHNPQVVVGEGILTHLVDGTVTLEGSVDKDILHNPQVVVGAGILTHLVDGTVTLEGSVDEDILHNPQVVVGEGVITILVSGTVILETIIDDDMMYPPVSVLSGTLV